MGVEIFLLYPKNITTHECKMLTCKGKGRKYETFTFFILFYFIFTALAMVS